MKDFADWYCEDYITEIDDPTVFKSPYKIPGKLGKWWAGLGSEDEVDWDAREKANTLAKKKWQDQLMQQQTTDPRQAALDLRKQKQDDKLGIRRQGMEIGAQDRIGGQEIGYGNADDPQVRQQKAVRLAQKFNQTLVNLAPGASSDTLSIIGRATHELANAFAGHPSGHPIGPSPIEDMLRAVHGDHGVDERNMKIYWQHHYPVLHELLRVFQRTPETWYNPKDSDNIFPPGTEIKKDQFTNRAASWKHDDDNKTTAKKDANVVDLMRRYIDPTVWRGKIQLPTIKRKLQDFISHVKSSGMNPVVNNDELLDYLDELDLTAPTPMP